MKKSLCLILSIMLALAMSFALTGCGEDETAAVKEAADGCLAAMQAGDFEKAKEFCTDEVFETGALSSFEQFDNITDSLTESIGIDEEDLSDDAKASVEEFKAGFLKSLISSYTINDATINDDGTATVNAEVTYGLDVDKLASADFSSASSDAEKIVTDYMTEHQSEIMKVYQEQGQDKAMVQVVNAVLPDLMDYLTKMINEAAEGETVENSVLTLEQNDDGAWLVKEMKATK